MAYQGISNRSPINGRIGSDFYVVFYDDSPGLAYFVKTSILCGRKAKSVASDDHAVLKNNPISNYTPLTNDHMGMNHRVIAYGNARIKHDVGIDGDAGTDPAPFADYSISADADIGSGGYILGNGRRRMYSPIGAGRDEEDFERMSKSKIWIRSPKAWDADRGNILTQNYGGGLGTFNMADIFPVRNESEITGTGLVDTCDPRNLDILVSNHPTVNSSRDFRKLHKTPQIICR
jgi:hypothetical protein